MKFTSSMRFYLRCLPVLLLVLLSTHSNAQYTIIGQNSFGGTNIYGPTTSSAAFDTFFSRHAYMYPQATLGQLKHGDTIRSFEFFKSGTNSFGGSPMFRIYVSMSTASDFGAGNIHWTKEAAKTGTIKVFEGSPTAVAGSTIGFKRFEFNQNFFVFDTTKGGNLKILVEFIQYMRQGNPVSWVYENDFSVPDFISNNETKYVSDRGLPKDSTNFSNVRKPYIKINYPRFKDNLEVNKIYCLGRVPVLMGRADSIMANVTNSGLKTVYQKKIYLKVSGANNFMDSLTLDSIQPFQTKMVVFGSHKPDTQGVEVVKVFIGKDDFAFDNVDSVRRIVGYNVYSHADPFMANSGGIGFNGSTGDFVAKFYTDSIIYVNQIKVDFANGGQKFQMGIWEANSSGLPGKNIFTSDTVTSVTGTYILPVLPRVKIDGGYFVGLRQTGTVNLAFAFQFEIPVRPNAFYFAAPLGDTAWVPFSPGFNYNFNIQPRIQVANDVAVLRMDYPRSGDTIEYKQYDSIAPKATIVNYGFNDQKAPFDVVCEIRNQYNKLVYADTATITLKGNDSTTITFDKRMSLNNYGPMKMTVFTKLHSDKVIDNDTLSSSFLIVVRYDVALENYFDPFEGQKFQLNTDKVGPVVRVANFGASNQSNVMVTSRIRQGTKIARIQTKSVSLLGSGSAIVTFDSFTIPWWGDVVFEAFVWNARDSFATNDTFRVNVYVDKSHDIGVVSIVKPLDSSRHDRKSQFQPYVNLRNFGVKDQDSVLIYGAITNSNGKLIYADSVKIKIVKFSTTQVLFKKFNVPDTVQWLKFMVICKLKADQDKSNDTAISFFNAVSSRDLAIKPILEPINKKVYNTSTTFTPKAVITNLGNNTLASTPVFYCTIRNAVGNLEYFDSAVIPTGLQILNKDTLVFNKSYTAIEKGLYRCKIWHKWNLDNERTNDSLIATFEISYLQSVRALTLDIPEHNAIYNFNGPALKPRFTVKNDGVNDLLSKTKYTLIIHGSSGELYNQTGIIDSLKADEIKSIELATTFKLNMPDKMQALLTITNIQDIYHLDDTIRNDFRVANNYDVAALNINYPGVDSTIFVNRVYAPKATFKNVGDSSLNVKFRLTYLILDASKVIYSSNKDITLASGATQKISFDSTFIAPDRGIFTSMAIVRLANDQNSANDTFVGKFNAEYFMSSPVIQGSAYRIYPNPANTLFVLEHGNMEDVEVRIFNSIGKQVSVESTKTNNTLQFDLSNIKPDMYLVEILSEQGIFYKKLLVY